ncbi:MULTISPECIES: RHS repeat-associated core domain-containing protein [Streptomyces]|nr:MULTISPECIES: RHS repeat-associated core domain-containing protein [Streptomyces]
MHPRTGGHLELHDHWGSPTTTSPTARRYSGAYLDPTGLYKMGARYYDPHIGRFTHPGPSGQETNPYLYAAGDRVNQTDPTYLASLLGAVGGAAVGAVASTLLDGVLGPVIGGAADGCAGGAVTALIDGSSVGKACAVGALTGAVSGGTGAVTKSLKAARTGS